MSPTVYPASPASSLFHQKREIEREQILHNPFRAPSALTFIKAITIWSIWPSVTFFTGVATVVILIHHSGTSLAIPSTILTVLGTVLGFVVSYRTSSAYERYNDGRKQWSSIILGGRTLARLIWLHCPNSRRPADSSRPFTEEERLSSIIEKKTIINLIEGFAVSLKHYLRGEHGIYYEDLYHLACFLPKYAFPAGHPIGRSDLDLSIEPCSTITSPLGPSGEEIHAILETKTQSNEESDDIEPGPQHLQPTNRRSGTRKATAPLDPFSPDHELLPAYNPPHNDLTVVLPFLSVFRSAWKGTRNITGLRRRKGVYARVLHDDNVPLEIIWYLSSYIALLQERKVIDTPTTTALLATMVTLSDSLTTLERILTTPIPFGYLVHLKLVVWTYLLFLPFQLVSTFGYITIPAVTVVSTAFLGFLRVGEEIENPFGYDFNDLDMDHFCHHIISPELTEITAWSPPDPTRFIFSSSNIPLIGHRDRRSGAALLNSGLSADELQDLLRTRASRNGGSKVTKTTTQATSPV